MAALNVQIQALMFCLIISFVVAEKAAEEKGRPESVPGLQDTDFMGKAAGADHAHLYGNQYLGRLQKPAEKEEGRMLGSQDLDLVPVEPDHAASMETSRGEDDGKSMPAGRRRRSDDANAVEAVVSKQAATILQLQAQLQALTARVDQLAAPVAASARFSRPDITHLGIGQTLVFDHVIHNAGGGYDSSTGVFTATMPGSYVVSVNLQRHGADETTVILGIRKGTQLLAEAEAGYSIHEHGSMLVTTHLDQGETISVHVDHGTLLFGATHTVFSVFRVSP